MTATKIAPDSERTKELMASTSTPPTEDEVVAIMASRIADQVDFDLTEEISKKLKKPKKVTTWRTCPNCGSRATKIFCVNPTNGKAVTCQICNHNYNPPGQK